MPTPAPSPAEVFRNKMLALVSNNPVAAFTETLNQKNATLFFELCSRVNPEQFFQVMFRTDNY